MSDSKKQIAFMGTPEYRKRLQQEALRRDMKVQTLLEEAVELFLSSGSSVSETALNSDDQALVAGIREALASAPRDADLRRVLAGLIAENASAPDNAGRANSAAQAATGTHRNRPKAIR